MEFPVVWNGKTVGNCVLEEAGLYWSIDCSCRLLSDRVGRLYCGPVRLGVLIREGDRLVLRRRVSKASVPQLPPRSGVLSLAPTEEPVPWQGEGLGYPMTGFRLGDTLLIPYDEAKPCPCEPLFCFFEIRDGFWQLPLNDGTLAPAP